MISVSGIRGRVGHVLTPDVVARYAAADAPPSPLLSPPPPLLELLALPALAFAAPPPIPLLGTGDSGAAPIACLGLEWWLRRRAGLR